MIQSIVNPDLQIDDWPKPRSRPEWRSVWTQQDPKAVLFDLDGTLLDTAADLGAVANSLRSDFGLPPLDLQALRPHASSGARGMIWKALGIAFDDPRFEPLRLTFLERYQTHLCVHTRFMPGLERVVQGLEQRGLPWGVVTNKFSRFTEPLIQTLGLDSRMAICVSGDTTPYAKPHPEPLRYACQRLSLPNQSVVYVGDDFRDIQSGFNAGCHTIAVRFGFGAEGQPIEAWGADAIAHSAFELEDLLRP